MKCFKLTDQDGRTRGNTQWGPGVTHSGTGRGDLCGPGWIHGYNDPLVAVLHNPIHADITNPRLWECEGDGKHLDDRGLKIGYEHLTTVQEIPVPGVTTTQRVAYAIYCVMEYYDDPAWLSWASDWLSGADRSVAAADAAAAAAMVARTAAMADSSTSRTTEDAAETASWTAEAASEWTAARTAARASRAWAWASAWAAAEAAAEAATNAPIDFPALARRAMEVKP